MTVKANSFAFCGGAYGDEGKGRIVDEYVAKVAKKGPVVVYRDNGGANAGHTVTLPTGERIALHQLPSGIFCQRASVILGKGMVVHPGDLLAEMADVGKVIAQSSLAKIMLDEMAVLSLDTHRAYEAALKMWQEGGKGSTGRGISPAYADVLLRHPIRARDLTHFDTKKIENHYKLYEALLTGLGQKMANMEVPCLGEPHKIKVGSLAEFVARLKKQAKALQPITADVSEFVARTWQDPEYSYIFEKAQAVGLDYRWGVYPDVTASTTTFDGIFSSTEGRIDPADIKVRAAVIKATYMSSVGTRILPTEMEEKLASRIREDAHEYGATTKRPRGIAYLDIPSLRFFAQVGNVNYHVLTHMDIVYPDTPIKVCVSYKRNGKTVGYRPDQEYLRTVEPVYQEFKPWSAEKIQQAKNYQEMPVAAQKFLKFMATALGTKILMVTTGPQRDQSIKIPSKV